MIVSRVGDILMLSQTAWRIERAFAASQKDAPANFRIIEMEVGGLARALKLLAETLHANEDNNTISNPAGKIQNEINTIIASCQRTVNDLDSLISQYQVIKKHRTLGGFAIEITWSDLVLDEYNAVSWTLEGGSIQTLGDVLHLHTSSIALVTQTVQSLISRWKSIIIPLADRINRMYHSSRTVSEQVGEVQALVDELAIIDSTVQAPPIPPRNPARSPTAELSDPLRAQFGSSENSDTPFRLNSSEDFTPKYCQHPQSPERCTHTDSTPTKSTPGSQNENLSTPRTSFRAQTRGSQFSFTGSPLRYSSDSYASSDARPSFVGCPGPNSTQEPSRTSLHTQCSRTASFLPGAPELPQSGRQASGKPLPLLPSAILDVSKPDRGSPCTPRSKFNFYPSSQPELMKLHGSASTTSQKAKFEKEAFQNCAILCDVRAKLVEYSQPLDDESKSGVEMVTASEECRIAVVRKRLTDPENKLVRVVTSIWTLSDNGAMRMELRMADDQMYIPYSSYFSLSKVSITVPCKLKFHDVEFGNRPLKTTRTTWVNYIFETAEASALFQNELMGRTLLATFRTERTMRLHEGIGGHFAYAEQLCALENLRVWKDNNTGAIIALVHFSANFRHGYLAFYINSSVNPIKVKDEGGREVKIKGLRVPIDRGHKALRHDSMNVSRNAGDVRDNGRNRAEDAKKKIEKGKIISGAKIEFRTVVEKKEFLEMCKEMQQNLIELPDLLGVN